MSFFLFSVCSFFPLEEVCAMNVLWVLIVDTGVGDSWAGVFALFSLRFIVLAFAGLYERVRVTKICVRLICDVNGCGDGRSRDHDVLKIYCIIGVSFVFERACRFTYCIPNLDEVRTGSFL